MHIIRGTPKPDKLIGTANADIIIGLQSVDFLLGRRGDDLLFGEFARDISANFSRYPLANKLGRSDFSPDVLLGQQGSDSLYGDAHTAQTIINGFNHKKVSFQFSPLDVLFEGNKATKPVTLVGDAGDIRSFLGNRYDSSHHNQIFYKTGNKDIIRAGELGDNNHVQGDAHNASIVSANGNHNMIRYLFGHGDKINIGMLVGGDNNIQGDVARASTTLLSANHNVIHYRFGSYDKIKIDTISGGDSNFIQGDARIANISFIGGNHNYITYRMGNNDSIRIKNIELPAFTHIISGDVSLPEGIAGIGISNVLGNHNTIRYAMGDNDKIKIGMVNVERSVVTGDGNLDITNMQGNNNRVMASMGDGDKLIINHLNTFTGAILGDGNTTVKVTGNNNSIYYKPGNYDHIIINNTEVGRILFITGDGDASTQIGTPQQDDVTYGNKIIHLMGDDFIELGTLNSGASGVGRQVVIGDTEVATTTINAGKGNFVYYRMGNDKITVDVSNAAVDLFGDIVSPDIIIDADSHNNTVIYQFGNDIITGGVGSQSLVGDTGNIVINVDDQSMNNTIKFIYGDDILTGNAGADTFIFRVSEDNMAGQGNDIITDLSADDGDILEFTNVDVTNNPIEDLDNDLKAVTDDGTDVVIEFQDDATITLLGIGTGSLTSLQALDDAGYIINIPL